MNGVVSRKRIHFPSIFDLPTRKCIPFISELQILQAKLERNQLVNDMLVHGSYGDFTFTNFSDVEITVLLNCDTTESKPFSKYVTRKIQSEINQLIVSIDPLQHHGAFYLTHDQIRNYDERLLPLCAYEKGWSVRGSTIDFDVSIPVAQISNVSQARLDITMSHLADLDRGFFTLGRGMYSIKRAISNFFMVPVYYYQSKGISLNKRRAINMALTEFPQIMGEPLACASEIRQQWPTTPGWVRFLRQKTIRDKVPQNRADILFANTYRDARVVEIFDIRFREALRFFIESSRGIFYDPR